MGKNIVPLLKDIIKISLIVDTSNYLGCFGGDYHPKNPLGMYAIRNNLVANNSVHDLGRDAGELSTSTNFTDVLAVLFFVFNENAWDGTFFKIFFYKLNNFCFIEKKWFIKFE